MGWGIEIATRISQYEMAYRITRRRACPSLDLSTESSEDPGSLWRQGGSGFSNNCLLARRMVERGVRFVQLFDQGWDHHGGLQRGLPNKCKQVDQPIAALLKDLKERACLMRPLLYGS